MTVKQMAQDLDAAWEGNGDLEITGVQALEEAGPSDLSFAEGRRGEKRAAESRAGCLLARPDYEAGGRTVIRVAQPRQAFAQVVRWFHPAWRPAVGVEKGALVAASARLGEGVAVGAGAVIGAGAVVGDRTVVGPRSVVGEGVTLGDDCLLHAGVTLYPRVRVGHRAVLHTGCVIGADGFGFVFEAGRYQKFPQVGTVELGDDVEIGANSCVDRGALGATRIGDGTKLDNLVHIGHNCRIGRHVVIAAQTGLSGAVEVGDYAVIGGQVGIGDKARIEPGAVLGSGCGVLTSKIVRAGEPVWGTPARPLKQYLERLAVFDRLPRILAKMNTR